MARRLLEANRHMRDRLYMSDRIDILHDDVDIYQRYRFSQNSINVICDLLRTDLERRTGRSHAIPVDSQVKLALRFYASGSFLNVVGDSLGYHKSTVSRVVRDVSEALAAKADEFIKWPVTADKRNRSRHSFFAKANFPGVIGCVDGTHVRIQAPATDEFCFVNRKNFHSINVQAICDGEGCFTNVVAKWPGSCHDSHIFKTSKIGKHLEAHHRGLDVDGIILGDSGYAGTPYLITPYLRPANRTQEKFNSAHTRTRVAIEQVFGRWKRRFHCLHGEIRMAPERVCNVIMACAVLHNIATLLKEPVFDADPADDSDEEDQNINNLQNNNQNLVNTEFVFFSLHGSHLEALCARDVHIPTCSFPHVERTSQCRHCLWFLPK